jgi:hypothetical protein
LVFFVRLSYTLSYSSYLGYWALLPVRNLNELKTRRTPPATVTHLLRVGANSGTLTKLNPILRKYKPNSKQSTNNNNAPPPLAMIK